MCCAKRILLQQSVDNCLTSHLENRVTNSTPADAKWDYFTTSSTSHMYLASMNADMLHIDVVNLCSGDWSPQCRSFCPSKAAFCGGGAWAGPGCACPYEISKTKAKTQINVGSYVTYYEHWLWNEKEDAENFMKRLNYDLCEITEDIPESAIRRYNEKRNNVKKD